MVSPIVSMDFDQIINAFMEGYQKQAPTAEKKFWYELFSQTLDLACLQSSWDDNFNSSVTVVSLSPSTEGDVGSFIKIRTKQALKLKEICIQKLVEKSEIK